MLLIIGVIAGAVAGGLVEYLLGLWLPEKPKIRHIAAILVFVLILTNISIWASPEDEQTDEVVVALTGIQTREAELATAFANFSNTSLSENGEFLSTSEAYATQIASLELTRLFLETEQATPTARPSQTPTTPPTTTRTPRPTNSSTPRSATVESITHTPEPPIQTATSNLPATSTVLPSPTNQSVSFGNITSMVSVGGGISTLRGRVVWNGSPYANVRVVMNSGGETLASAITDVNGYFTFTEVPAFQPSINPELDVTTNLKVFGGTRYPIISEGEIFELGDLPVVKGNLQLYSPTNGDSFLDGKPTFSWQVYPSASTYRLLICREHPEYNATCDITFEGLTNSTFTLIDSLGSGRYFWGVEAYNSNGEQIGGQFVSDYGWGINEFTVP